jgi:threonine dehydratase
VLQQFTEAIALVSEDEIRETVKYLLLRLRVLVEPSGAVSAAAVLFGKLPPGIASVGVILSGGNMDFAQLAAF